MHINNQWEMDNIPRSRRFSVSSERDLPPPSALGMRFPGTSEDLHAWSIYRQNLNSDFTDSALGSKEKSPLPYGNFQLRESTMQSILNNPKYGPKSELGKFIILFWNICYYVMFAGINMYTYLKFGLPRVMPMGLDEVYLNTNFVLWANDLPCFLLCWLLFSN